MKKRLRSFLTCLGSVALVLSFSVFISCGDVIGPKKDHTGITTPLNGSYLTANSLPLIKGWFKENSYYGNVTAVRIKFGRYSDGKYWNGTSWGGGETILTPDINHTTKTWEIAGSLPSGTSDETGLSDGSYNIQATVIYTTEGNPDNETSVSVFTVGTTAPPMVPTLYAWGENTNGRLGTETLIPHSYQPVPVYARGVLEGKVLVTLSAEDQQSFALSGDGRIYSWGDDSHGQLGGGVHAGTVIPQPRDVHRFGALSGETVIGVDAGETHTLAFSRDWVFAWGSNDEGELGNNTFGPTHTFYPGIVDMNSVLQVGEEVVVVSAGNNFSAALTSEGRVFTWGANFSGQLGDGSSAPRQTAPVLVQGLLASKVVTAISAGSTHMLVLTQEGELYAFGENSDNQLGSAVPGVDSNVPVRVLETGALAGKRIVGICAGGRHSLAVDDTGVVYAWGANYDNQIGTGSVSTDTRFPVALGGGLVGKKVTRLFAGGAFNYVITDNNEIYCWGSNHKGELTNQFEIDPFFDTAEVKVPTRCTSLENALSAGRIVYDMACGEDHVLMLTGFDPTLQPDIAVQAQGTGIAHGGTLNYGTNAVGSSTPIAVTIRNEGKGTLADISASITGPDQSDFDGTSYIGPIEPGNTTDLLVYFNPTATGQRNATLHIASNDPDEDPYDIALTGSSYPTGEVDLAFDPGMSTSTLRSLSVQPDGKILVGSSAFFVNGPGGPVVRYVARMDGTTGTADSFNPVLYGESSDTPLCSAVLPDGKIMIGGWFTTVGGVARNRLARLYADGTLDESYNAQITFNGIVFAMALQSDGKLVVAGNFSAIGGGTQPYLARLNANGTLDTAFAPVLSNIGRSVAVQADGNIVVSGAFTSVNGQGFNKLARVSGIDGSLDPTFTNPNIVTSGNIECVAVQADGKILLGGNAVMTVNGETRNRICRLNSNGTLDTGFNPDVNNGVRSIVVQANGRILISGVFTTVGGTPGTPRNRIAMLLPNGQLEQFFNPNANNAVNGVTLQADGKILASGDFTNIGGEPRNSLARLSNGAATQSLVVDNSGRIEWQRGGSAPETNLVTFEVSGDLGENWTQLGAATRMSGGWELHGLTLPPVGYVRAHAYPQGAYYNGSVSHLYTLVAYGYPPGIEVTENGVPISFFGRDFGVVATGSASSTALLTIQNTGGSPLTGLSGATIGDIGASHFELGKPASGTLAPGATTTLTVTYRPKTTGWHIALLRIPNNSFYSNPVNIRLYGTGSLPITTWRAQNHNGETTNTGDAADTAIPAGDGMTNLEKYAIGKDPKVPTDDGTSVSPPSGGSFAPFAESTANGAAPVGGTFFFNYQRNKLAMADVQFQVEWSDTLAPNDWYTEGITEEILSDDDSIQQVQATVPVGTAGRRFVRLKMTRP